MVDAERLELLGPDAQGDDVRFRRPDGDGDGRSLRGQAADDGEDGDGRGAEADLVHQPFLSEIISSTSSRSFARRSSSRAMTGTPRMLMRTRARSTNMTESFSTTRLRFDTTSALRSRARSASPTPVISARVPRDPCRSSRSRRRASASNRTYNPPGAEYRNGGTPSSKNSPRVRRERIETPNRV